MIDALAEMVALVRSDNSIVATNAHWRRAIEQQGAWGFAVGGDYGSALSDLIEAGDERLKPVLNAFREIGAGARKTFRCIYKGSGILSGRDYNIQFSRLQLCRETFVLISAEDFTELNDLKRQRRRIGSEVLRAQENERRRMARELHDSTSQLLAAIKMNLMRLEDETKGSVAGALTAECKELVDAVLQEVRSFTFVAHPPTLVANDLADGGIRVAHWPGHRLAGVRRRRMLCISRGDDVSAYAGRLIQHPPPRSCRACNCSADRDQALPSLNDQG